MWALFSSGSRDAKVTRSIRVHHDIHEGDQYSSRFAAIDHKLMDLSSRCILSFIVPISMELAKTSYVSLAWAILLVNPFTIVLLISVLDHLVSIESPYRYRNIDFEAKRANIENQDDKRSSSSERVRPTSCCSAEEDRNYVYYKHWLFSTHFAQLYALNLYVFPSNRLSSKETNLLLASYALLVFMISKLKRELASRDSKSRSILNSNPIIALPLTEAPASGGALPSGSPPLRCENICYLKQLAHPTATASKTDDQPNENRDAYLSIDTFEDDLANSNHVIYNTRMFTKKLLCNLNPTHKWFLRSCNFLHILILAQLLYLNVTCSCESRLTRFGSSLLVPVDCSAVYEDTSARITMFNAIFSGQLLCCHIVYLFLAAR